MQAPDETVNIKSYTNLVADRDDLLSELINITQVLSYQYLLGEDGREALVRANNFLKQRNLNMVQEKQYASLKDNNESALR